MPPPFAYLHRNKSFIIKQYCVIAKNIFKLNEQIIAEHQIAAGTEHVNAAHIYCTTVSVGQDLARLSSPRPGLSHSCDGGVGPGATVSPVRWLARWLLAVFGSSWAVGLEPQIHIRSYWKSPSVPCPGASPTQHVDCLKCTRKQ